MWSVNSYKLQYMQTIQDYDENEQKGVFFLNMAIDFV